MKATRILMAALLLAGCVASCSKDDDGTQPATGDMPTFETLYGYYGRTDTDAIADEFRQAGYVVELQREGTLYCAKYINGHQGSPLEDEEGDFYRFRINEGKIAYVDYEYVNRDEAPSVTKSKLAAALSGQKSFGARWTLAEYIGAYYSEDNSTHYSSIDDLINALPSLGWGDEDELVSECVYSNGISSYAGGASGYVSIALGDIDNE